MTNPPALYELVVKAKHLAAADPIHPAVPLQTYFANVFDHVCALICSKPLYAELAEYIRNEGKDTLQLRAMSDCARALGHLTVLGRDGESWKLRDFDALMSLQSYHGVRSAGWYFIVLTDENDPAWRRLYVGQATDIHRRAQDHKTRYKRELNKLLYRLWNRPGRTAEVYVLGTTNNPDPKWLDIVEQFWSVALQTLLPGDLDKWIPDTVERASEAGLNVNLPINQSHSGNFHAHWMYAFASTDPEIVAYAQAIIDKTHGTARATDYHELSATNRSKPSRSGKPKQYRDPEEGDPRDVTTYCEGCKDPNVTWVDTRPSFSVQTGEYVARRCALCNTCPVSETDQRAGYNRARTYQIPLDHNLSYVHDYDLHPQFGRRLDY